MWRFLLPGVCVGLLWVLQFFFLLKTRMFRNARVSFLKGAGRGTGFGPMIVMKWLERLSVLTLNQVYFALFLPVYSR